MVNPTSTEITSGADHNSELVVVLDFGAQYTQLIARRIREQSVYCEIVPFDTSIDTIKAKNPKGIVFSGGPSSVYEEGAPHSDPGIYDLGVPILGICYGVQLMSYQLGGEVRSADQREYGGAELTVIDPDPLFEGIENTGTGLNCWMSHGDSIGELPDGFTITASTSNTRVAAAEDARRKTR